MQSLPLAKRGCVPLRAPLESYAILAPGDAVAALLWAVKHDYSPSHAGDAVAPRDQVAYNWQGEWEGWQIQIEPFGLKGYSWKAVRGKSITASGVCPQIANVAPAFAGTMRELGVSCEAQEVQIWRGAPVVNRAPAPKFKKLPLGELAHQLATAVQWVADLKSGNLAEALEEAEDEPDAIAAPNSMMQTVFENGEILTSETFAACRERMAAR